MTVHDGHAEHDRDRKQNSANPPARTNPANVDRHRDDCDQKDKDGKAGSDKIREDNRGDEGNAPSQNASFAQRQTDAGQNEKIRRGYPEMRIVRPEFSEHKRE